MKSHLIGCTCAICLAVLGLATKAPETCDVSADNVFYVCPIVAPEPSDFHEGGDGVELVPNTPVVAMATGTSVTANASIRLDLRGPDPFKPGGKFFTGI